MPNTSLEGLVPYSRLKDRVEVLQVSREILTPPTLAVPRGYEYGILTTGGKPFELYAPPPLDVLDGSPHDMPAQFDAALIIMNEQIQAYEGKLTDITSFSMWVSDVSVYRDPAVLRALGSVWKRHFGKNYFATKLIQLPQSQMMYEDRLPLISLTGRALVDAPPEESEGSTLSLGGQNGFNEKGDLARGDVVEQTRHVMRGLGLVLREAGITFNDVLATKLRIFIDPRVYFQHKDAISVEVARTAGAQAVEDMTVSAATGFFEEDAMVEIDGSAKLQD